MSVAYIPCFSAIGGGDGQVGVNGVVDYRCAGAVANKRRQP